MQDEEWQTIPEFPNYLISSYGNIHNMKIDRPMRTSRSNYGHRKITLNCDWNEQRFTRSVALFVAEAFVEPPNGSCDHIMVLDGDLDNIAAENLAWRPRWFAWQYTHQLRTPQPMHYHNLPVFNLVTGKLYNSIIEAGMTEGLLFADIWRSTYTGSYVYPNHSLFKVAERV